MQWEEPRGTNERGVEVDTLVKSVDFDGGLGSGAEDMLDVFAGGTDTAGSTRFNEGI